MQVKITVLGRAGDTKTMVDTEDSEAVKDAMRILETHHKAGASIIADVGTEQERKIAPRELGTVEHEAIVLYPMQGGCQNKQNGDKP